MMYENFYSSRILLNRSTKIYLLLLVTLQNTAWGTEVLGDGSTCRYDVRCRYVRLPID